MFLGIRFSTSCHSHVTLITLPKITASASRHSITNERWPQGMNEVYLNFVLLSLSTAEELGTDNPDAPLDFRNYYDIVEPVIRQARYKHIYRRKKNCWCIESTSYLLYYAFIGFVLLQRMVEKLSSTLYFTKSTFILRNKA